jgi:Fe-S oxidoreductase
MCPSRDANYFDAYGSRGRLQILKAALEGKVKINEEFADIFFNCALCQWCTYRCPAEIKTTDLFLSARYEAVRKGVAPKISRKVMQYIIQKRNPFGERSSAKISWSKGLGLGKNGNTLLFASCMNTLIGYQELIHNTGIPVYKIVNIFEAMEKLRIDVPVRHIVNTILNPNKKYQETLRRAVKILRTLGIEPAYLYEDEPCCGKPLHTYGFMDEFEQHARKVAALFKGKNINHIIVLNPACLYTFRILYPQFIKDFSNIEVKHISEIIAENLDKWGDKAFLNTLTVVTYHDPCYMSRYIDLTQPPRTVITNIKNVKFVETKSNRKNTYCTGDGGVEATHPTSSSKIALTRARMLLETNADKIVTTCPACIMMIKLSIKSLKIKKKVEVVDLVDLFYQSIFHRD